MNADDGYRLICKALENSAKDKLYIQWLHDDARYEIGFDEYMNALKPYQSTSQNEKERILKKYGGG